MPKYRGDDLIDFDQETFIWSSHTHIFIRYKLGVMSISQKKYLQLRLTSEATLSLESLVLKHSFSPIRSKISLVHLSTKMTRGRERLDQQIFEWHSLQLKISITLEFVTKMRGRSNLRTVTVLSCQSSLTENTRCRLQKAFETPARSTEIRRGIEREPRAVRIGPGKLQPFASAEVGG